MIQCTGYCVEPGKTIVQWISQINLAAAPLGLRVPLSHLRVCSNLDGQQDEKPTKRCACSDSSRTRCPEVRRAIARMR